MRLLVNLKANFQTLKGQVQGSSLGKSPSTEGQCVGIANKSIQEHLAWGGRKSTARRDCNPNLQLVRYKSCAGLGVLQKCLLHSVGG